MTLAGVPVPAEIGVHYSSWATHHLPQLYPDPFRFDPDRFLPEREAALPRGAYVPFGGGSRMCLGKRFGEYELRALAAVLLHPRAARAVSARRAPDRDHARRSGPRAACGSVRVGERPAERYLARSAAAHRGPAAASYLEGDCHHERLEQA